MDPIYTQVPELETVSEAEVKLETVRNNITMKAGDQASLLGTTADATQLLLFGFTSLVAALNTANSLADVREAAAPFNDLAVAFQAKVESGDVKLPFMAKGLESVVTDIEQRATAVAEVLQSATEGGN
ncbi:MAG: hypothetical protein ABW146_08625 [Candidatus Sedimenticola sp. 6PFRAG7]